MTVNQIHINLNSIIEPYNGILLDAYGVFWAGNNVGIIPGSKEMMENLVNKGKIVGILSNSTQMASKEINKLASHGLLEGQHYHFLITSGEVARKVFQEGEFPFPIKTKKFYVFGTIHPKFGSHTHLFENTLFLETNLIHEADFIYISIPHINGEDQINPDVFLEDIEKINHSKLPMVCANPDLFAHEGNPPRLVVRQGTIAALYEQMGGHVFYIGKPSLLAFSYAMNYFLDKGITQKNSILMVGDTPETDIRGANSFGMDSALILKTGVTAERINTHGLEQILEQLPLKDQPTFMIERLG